MRTRRLPMFVVSATVAVCVLAWPRGADAQGSFLVLHTFEGSPSDGGQPSFGPGLILGHDGTLYGTTFNGGSVSLGSVFRIATDGTGFALLHSFNGDEGAGPNGALLQAADGTLYGTTANGGSLSGGTIYQMDPDGNGFAVLHSFGGGPTDGQYPQAGLIQGSDGALYGTTYQGGPAGLGTVFKIAPDGTGFMLLHSFAADGNFPRASLIQGADGALYGTTAYGGAANGGTVFRIGPDGDGYSLLRDLATSDGTVSLASLIQGADGTLYGTTANGGASNFGTVFQIAPDGSGFAVLHNFDISDGVSPNANVIQGSDGTLYGTTTDRGDPGSRGTIFQMASDGSGFTVVHNFSGSDGANPWVGLLQGPDGTFYGTTSDESTLRNGVIFSLSLGAVTPQTITRSYLPH